ncbi:MAG TPA: deoxynucleoside kinase, partial [Steroidobacteraceae bacterium]
YADMPEFAFRSQIFVLIHRFRIHKEMEGLTETVVQDRTIYEDAEIFARNLHRQRTIDARDWRLYHALYKSRCGALKPPDLMIQLRCPVRTLRQRIRLRGRAMERDIPVAYLRRLNRLYEEWFRRWDLSPVLQLETDRLDWATDLVDRVDLFRKIEKYLD